jgi:hypothetical protein
MRIYTDWGFTDNPFQQTRLLPNAQGETLLVGRDVEIEALLRQLLNPPKLPLLEGANGVGKTSLINVTAFKAFTNFLQDLTQPLLVPCSKSFQLELGKDVNSFCDEVFLEVAQTLLKHGKLIKERCAGKLSQTDSINSWLNSASFTSWQGGIPILNLGGGTQSNESAGFERSGFRKVLHEWLDAVFPSSSNGGVVCVIDNLELLQTSEAAKSLLEQLRDSLLTVHDLRCVLCGANGITWTLASSMRLEGILHRPLEVAGIQSSLAHEILRSRIAAYSVEEKGGYLPIFTTDFELLYELQNKNLRALLSQVDDYCMWASNSALPQSEEEKRATFQTWLREQCENISAAAESSVTARAWQLFDKVIAEGGSFSPNEFAKFNFNSGPALRPYVKVLEDANLLFSYREDNQDQRRKNILVTPRGRLVAFHRKQRADAQD